MKVHSCSTTPTSHQRRGTAAVFVVVMLPVIMGLAALTIDVGVIYSTRADLQNAADAAALAGASAYASEEMMGVRMGSQDPDAFLEVANMMRSAVHSLSPLNGSFGVSQTAVEPSDIVFGWIDTASGTSPIQTAVSPAQYNAVQVTVHRSAEGPNGPVVLFFASIFGRRDTEVSATAVAVLEDKFSVYETAESGPNLLPITVNIADYGDQFANGGDLYGYDEGSESVSTEGDGIREILLYPRNEAPGNRGLLNIGIPDLSSNELIRQITEGVTPEEFERETGSSELTFQDEYGAPATYDITGNPGLKSDLEDSLETLVGEVVGFFVHTAVEEQGSNAVYKISGLRFGRLMHVDLSGSVSSRGLWIQPITYGGPGVFTDVNVASSGGTAGRVALVR